MNKKFLISWAVVFVVWMIGSFVVHGLLLGADYLAAEPNPMRSGSRTAGHVSLDADCARHHGRSIRLDLCSRQ